MTKVLRVLRSDVCRVRGNEAVPDDLSPSDGRRRDLLSGLRACRTGLAACTEILGLIDAALEGLQRHWDISHPMALMLDPSRACLSNFASRGCLNRALAPRCTSASGPSALPPGNTHRSGSAMRCRITAMASHPARFADRGVGIALETQIPPSQGSRMRPASQLDVPLVVADRLRGVL